MRFCSSSILAAAVCCLASASAFAGNPMYDSWAKCAPGSSVTMGSVTETSGMKSESETVYTLKAVTPEKVTVEMKSTVSVMGNKMESPATTMDIPSGSDAKPGTPAAAGAPGADVKTTQEKVTVGGKEYDATCTVIHSDANGMKTTATTWTSPEVPGMTLKMSAETDGSMKSSTKMEVTKIEVK